MRSHGTACDNSFPPDRSVAVPIPNTLRVLRAGIVVTAVLGSACDVTAPEPAAGACTPDREPLRAVFYTLYAPVSYSADR